MGLLIDRGDKLNTTTIKDNELIIVECLKHAIADTQETIRGYDNKALILATLLTLSVGVTNYGLLASLKGVPRGLIILSWLVSIVAIALLGIVLHPRVNKFKDISLGKYTPTGVYFLHQVSKSATNSVTSLAEQAWETNWVEELTYENMKVSYIREKKHSWFVAALILTGVSLALIFLAILLGTSCV